MFVINNKSRIIVYHNYYMNDWIICKFSSLYDENNSFKSCNADCV